MPNKKDIDSFLSYFPSDHIVLCYFDKETSKVIPGCSHITGSLDKLKQELYLLNDLTVHILINLSDGQGRRNENITGCHSFFCDLDRVIDKEELKELLLKYEPHMVVQSSIGKFHFYWKCLSETTLAEWQYVQRGINGLFDSPEPNPDSLTHMLRMPGFERVCKDGSVFTPKIIYQCVNPIPVDPSERFPGFSAKARKHAKEKKHEKEKIYKAINVDLHDLKMPEVRLGNRNNTLFLVLFGLVKAGKVNCIERLGEFASKLNAQMSSPLTGEEVIGITKSAWSRGYDAFEREAEKLRIAKGIA